MGLLPLPSMPGVEADDLCLRWREVVTTGLWRSSSSLYGGPSPKVIAGNCWVPYEASAVPGAAVHCPAADHCPLEPSHVVGAGSDNRRVSLEGVERPEE